MLKVFFSVILLFLLIPFHSSFAQSHDHWARKIYSGYLQYNIKTHTSFWHAFGKKPAKQKEDLQDRQCSIQFKSPVSFSHQLVVELPEELTYVVSFKKDGFKKFVIKIYTNDDEEYSIDPDAEGKQVGINDEHHILDSYLIYLILGENINRVEIVSASGDARYVLDKLEIKNDD